MAKLSLRFHGQRVTRKVQTCKRNSKSSPPGPAARAPAGWPGSAALSEPAVVLQPTSRPTLPSSGHAPASRVMPLMSNVRRAMHSIVRSVTCSAPGGARSVSAACASPGRAALGSPPGALPQRSLPASDTVGSILATIRALALQQAKRFVFTARLTRHSRRTTAGVPAFAAQFQR